jgi:chromosome segregation ATPase
MHQTLFEFWVAMPDNVDGMDSNPTYGSLKLELDSLPQRLLIGYDRKATDELFERLDASYQKLSREREHLRVQVEELSRRCAEAEAERNEVELRARAELDEIRSQLRPAHIVACS